MKMYNKQSEHEELKFLNTNAKGFFKSGNAPVVNFNSFKMNLLFALNTIENVCKGTFHSDLFVARVDEEKFEKLFPNGFRLFNKNIGQVAHFLDSLRNCCAHSILSEHDIEIFDYYFSGLDEEPKFNLNIKYTNNGKITIAGVIFLVFNFLREQTIKKLCKDNPIFGMVTYGKTSRDDGMLFVSKISHVDLENNPIRIITGSDIKTAILGQHIDKLNNDGSFSLAFGSPNNPLYRVNGVIRDNHITINSDSMTSVYYESNFDVEIEYEKGFIELANELPELLLVDLLKLQGFEIFDKKVYQSFTEKWDLIRKLNYPKYYEDKNIRTIFVTNEVADYRVMNSMINNAVTAIFIELEQRIYRNNNIVTSGYSKFTKAINCVIKNNEINSQIIALRNFAMHGRAWGEFTNVGSKIFYHSPEFAFETLRLLVLELKKTESELFSWISRRIDSVLIGKICSFRYNMAEIESLSYMNEYPNSSTQTCCVRENCL